MCAFFVSMLATYPPHLILLDLKFLIMKFSPFSCYFSFIGSNILPSKLFSNILIRSILGWRLEYKSLLILMCIVQSAGVAQSI
jgi:hypothetical protein